MTVSSIQTMEDTPCASVAPRRFNLRLLSVFAGAALVLAATGLYGVMSHGVVQRRHEIAIRMALGGRREWPPWRCSGTSDPLG